MKPTWLDRALRPFADVRAGEGLRVVAMMASLLILMVSYYLLKTVREPLILSSGGAELKSYAAGIQAVVLIGYVRLYAWLTGKLGRRGLIIGVTGFFIVNLELFYLAVQFGGRLTALAFFVWCGIFSLSVIAQFWSLANDLYSRQQGERLFAIIAFGATVGSPIGARIAGSLFARSFTAGTLMQLAAVLLLLHGVLTLFLANTRRAQSTDGPLAAGSGGFSLILRNPYLKWVAALLILLNVVNTVGEYLLSKNVVAAAMAAVANGTAASKAEFIGAFYGGFFFWVNVSAALVQAFIVSRLVKWLGIRGVLLFLPLLSTLVYGTIGAGAGFALLRLLKTAENAGDYSVMNTGRAMIWLPTTREEKYRAKQTIDTLFVRFGDLLATALIAICSSLGLATRAVAVVNLLLCLAWTLVAWRVGRLNRGERQAPRVQVGRAQLQAA